MAQYDAFGEIRETDFPEVIFQLLRPDGMLLQTVDVAGIELVIFDLGISKTEPVSGPAPIVIGDVLFDTPVIDERWNADTIGYNFLHVVTDETWLLNGGRNYWLEYTFERLNGARPTWAALVKTIARNRP